MLNDFMTYPSNGENREIKRRAAFDFILVRQIGSIAADLVAKQQIERMSCRKAGKIGSVPLEETLEKMKRVGPNSKVIYAARTVGNTFGDIA